MVDLIYFINDQLGNYTALQGQYSRQLVEKNSMSTFTEIKSIYEAIGQEFNREPDKDIWKLYAACYVNSVLFLPNSPSGNSQESSFTPDLVESCINLLLYLWQNYQLNFAAAYERLVSKITEAINNCDDFEIILKWIEQAKLCKNSLNVDISSIEKLGSIKSYTELYKNATSDDKNVIFSNLEKLKKLKALNIEVDFIAKTIVDYAIKWIENTNDVFEYQSFFNQQVNKDPETSKKMLNIISEIGISDEKLRERINILNDKFPAVISPQEIVPKKLPIQDVKPIENNEEPTWICQRSQINVISAIHVHGDVGVYLCKILWKGQEIDAALKTYKDDDHHKSWEKCKKEAEILSILSGKSKYFLDYYGCFFDKILENGVEKYCSNIVMEFCPWTLGTYMKSKRDIGQKFTPLELNSIYLDLLEAFKILSSNKIYHRDIKPENILFNKETQVKIADFNVSRISEIRDDALMATGEHGVYGTPTYMSPELREAYINGLGKVKYRKEKADVFSLGLVFYQLATFEDISRFNQDPNRREALLQEMKIEWLKNLLYGMLNFNYHERFSFGKALSFLTRETTAAKEQ